MTHQQHKLPGHTRSSKATCLRHISLAATLAGSLCAGSAHAVVVAPAAFEFGGGMNHISYGNGGDIYQLDSMLFVFGLGKSANPQSVANSNAALQYSFLVSGQNTGLMTIEYSLRNVSTTESFSQLRFLVYANPDGAPDLADVLSETWGAAAKGDAVLREGRAFIDPVSGINVGFGQNNTLTEGLQALDAGCIVAPGCDATVGLQWNAATLAPGETFRVRLGLSDNGQSLSGRFLNIGAVSDPGTVLTFSGQSAIVPVPEPGAAGMLVAGLVSLGWLARRRRAG